MAKSRESSDKKSKKHREKSTTDDAPAAPAPIVPAVDIPTTTEANGVKKSKDKKDKKSRGLKSLGEDVTGEILDALEAEKANNEGESKSVIEGDKSDDDEESDDEDEGENPKAARASAKRPIVDPETVKYTIMPQIRDSWVPFAQPMAEGKTLKKVIRGVKLAAQHGCIQRGVKEVQKALRQYAEKHPGQPAETQHVVIIAGDISPPDVLSHLPVMCETHYAPYIYVPLRKWLGEFGLTARPTSTVLVPLNPNKFGKGAGGVNLDHAQWPAEFRALVLAVAKAHTAFRAAKNEEMEKAAKGKAG